MIVVSEAVRSALADGRPVVAMESTIYSTLGLPVPHNAEALRRCTAAVEAAGAVPAVTAGTAPPLSTAALQRRSASAFCGTGRPSVL